LHRRGPAGEVGPSRHADGVGAAGLYDLEPGHAFRSEGPDLAKSRPFFFLNGHASMLLGSLLYLAGPRAVNAEYERLGEPSVTLDDIRHFRQLGSKAPGHPEYHLVSGVETTTGPLGQGVATSVGMAIAQKWLA